MIEIIFLQWFIVYNCRNCNFVIFPSKFISHQAIWQIMSTMWRIVTSMFWPWSIVSPSVCLSLTNIMLHMHISKSINFSIKHHKHCVMHISKDFWSRLIKLNKMCVCRSIVTTLTYVTILLIIILGAYWW